VYVTYPQRTFFSQTIGGTDDELSRSFIMRTMGRHLLAVGTLQLAGTYPSTELSVAMGRSGSPSRWTPKRYLDWFSHFCTAEPCDQHTDTQTDTQSTLILKGRSFLNRSEEETRRATLGDRAFPEAAARAWNSLPPQTRTATSLTTFRRETEAHLFRQSYH